MGLLTEDELSRSGASTGTRAHYGDVSGTSASNAAASRSILSMLGKTDCKTPPSALPPPPGIAAKVGRAEGPVRVAATAVQHDPARQGKTLSVADLFHFAQNKDLPPMPNQCQAQQAKMDDLSRSDEATAGGKFASSSLDECADARQMHQLQVQQHAAHAAHAAQVAQQQAWAQYGYLGNCGGSYGWPPQYASPYHAPSWDPYQQAGVGGDSYSRVPQSNYKGNEAAATLDGMYSNTGDGFEESSGAAPPFSEAHVASVSEVAPAGVVVPAHHAKEGMQEADECAQS